MAEVLLFHHALGLTDGVKSLAEKLRAHDHTLHTPDLFEGRRFDTIEDGVAHARQVGFGELMARGAAFAETLRGEIVYSGISLGVLPAQFLAQTRAGARAAVLLEACAPANEFGESWPAQVAVQVHGMDADPFFAGEGDLEAARELVAATGRGELFLYRGGRHLFTDASLPSYDEAATALLLERVSALLHSV